MGVMSSEMLPSIGHLSDLWCHQVVQIVQMAMCTCVLAEQVIFDSTWKSDVFFLKIKIRDC